VGLLALILGALGAVGGVIGILTAVEVMPTFTDELTWMFWFVLSALLLLGSIASGRGGHE